MIAKSASITELKTTTLAKSARSRAASFIPSTQWKSSQAAASRAAV